jgi:hypothetical protein
MRKFFLIAFLLFAMTVISGEASAQSIWDQVQRQQSGQSGSGTADSRPRTAEPTLGDVYNKVQTLEQRFNAHVRQGERGSRASGTRRRGGKAAASTPGSTGGASSASAPATISQGVTREELNTVVENKVSSAIDNALDKRVRPFLEQEIRNSEDRVVNRISTELKASLKVPATTTSPAPLVSTQTAGETGQFPWLAAAWAWAKQNPGTAALIVFAVIVLLVILAVIALSAFGRREPERSNSILESEPRAPRTSPAASSVRTVSRSTTPAPPSPAAASQQTQQAASIRTDVRTTEDVAAGPRQSGQVERTTETVVDERRETETTSRAA